MRTSRSTTTKSNTFQAKSIPRQTLCRDPQIMTKEDKIIKT